MRSLLPSRRWIVATAVAGGMVIAAGGVTAYAASTSSPATTPTPSASASPAPGTKHGQHGQHGRSILAHADHATVEVKQNGKWVTVTVDRGNVTAASSSSITLARPDGQSVTLSINSSTKFRGKEATSASALKTNVSALVISQNGTAISVAEGTKPLPASH